MVTLAGSAQRAGVSLAWGKAAMTLGDLSSTGLGQAGVNVLETVRAKGREACGLTTDGEARARLRPASKCPAAAQCSGAPLARASFSVMARVELTLSAESATPQWCHSSVPRAASTQGGVDSSVPPIHQQDGDTISGHALYSSPLHQVQQGLSPEPRGNGTDCTSPMKVGRLSLGSLELIHMGGRTWTS